MIGLVGFYWEKLGCPSQFSTSVCVVTLKVEYEELKINVTNERKTRFSWLKLKNTPNVDSLDLELVVSDNQFLTIDFVPEKNLNIYKMDYDAMEWVKVDKLGDQVFLLSYY